MLYKAEYIWIDGTQPTAKLRSKTKMGVSLGRMMLFFIALTAIMGQGRLEDSYRC